MGLLVRRGWSLSRRNSAGGRSEKGTNEALAKILDGKHPESGEFYQFGACEAGLKGCAVAL
eukprot:9502012-Pyramimonas_sp.AAC.1